MAYVFKYDVFIAYASADAGNARRLYRVLDAVGYKVFLDSERLVGGDKWIRKIKEAHQQSLLTIVLQSDRSQSSHFQGEEILDAIDLSRGEGARRVVPVYLTATAARDTRRNLLGQIQAIVWSDKTSLLEVAQQIDSALKEARGRANWLHDVLPETLVIVTGCYHLAEIFDRPAAYELSAAVEDMGRSVKRVFLRAIVMGDVWFFKDASIVNHPNVISIGSANGLTGVIVNSGTVVREDKNKQWKVVRDRNRWALFGDTAEDTYEAVSSFKYQDLPAFTGEIWSGL